MLGQLTIAEERQAGRRCVVHGLLLHSDAMVLQKADPGNKRRPAVYVKVGAAVGLIAKALPMLPNLPNAFNNLLPLDSTACFTTSSLGRLLALGSAI